MKMIFLTAPNGSRFEVDPEKISLIEANDGSYAKLAKSIVRIDGETHAVLETNEEIDKLRNTV